MSPGTKVGVSPLSEEELSQLDLGHMKGLADALRPDLAKILSPPFDQNNLVTSAMQKAMEDYHQLGYENKVKAMSKILDAYTDGQLSVTVLLEGLDLTEPEKKKNNGFFGRFKRH